MTRVVRLSDALERRRRVLTARRWFSLAWLLRIEQLIKARKRAKEHA